MVFAGRIRPFPTVRGGVAAGFFRLDRFRLAQYVWRHGVGFPNVGGLGRAGHNRWLGTVHAVQPTFNSESRQLFHFHRQPYWLGGIAVRFGIYIYVDGSDLHAVADLLLRRLGEIAREFPHVRVIDDRFEKTPDMHPDDLPDWNLGLNFDLDRDSVCHVPRLLESIRSLAQESGRDFAVGYYDRRSKIDEDIGFIEPAKDFTGISRVLESLPQNG
jgi:hypothetical protein